MAKMECPFTVITEKVVVQILFDCMAYSWFHTVAQDDELKRLRRISYTPTPPPTTTTKYHSLRKHAYSNILKISPPKTWKFSDENSDIFLNSAQNIDCGYSLEPPRRGGSNEYPQSMLLSRNMKNNVYPWKPQFYYMKVGFKGVKLYRYVFVMTTTTTTTTTTTSTTTTLTTTSTTRSSSTGGGTTADFCKHWLV